MFKRSKFGIICVIFFILGITAFGIINVFAQEQITITTYYPSPYGSYMDLSVAGNLRLETSPTSPAADGPQIEWRTPSARHWNIDQLNDRMRFFTEDSADGAGAERMTILENGNVGINTPGPNAKLDVRPSDFSRPTNLCVRVNYSAASGVRNCPNGYYIAMGSYASMVVPPKPGYIICCQVCEDGGTGGAVGAAADGVCD